MKQYRVGRIKLYDVRDYPITINESTTPIFFPPKNYLATGAIKVPTCSPGERRWSILGDLTIVLGQEPGSTKERNCFTTISDAARLAKIADTLSEHRAIGRLSQVCERWIYSCVCFALDFDEQKRSGFRFTNIPTIDRISKPGLRGGRVHGPGVSDPH
jgi:hypothetical protein